MSGFFFHQEPENAFRLFMPLGAATQTFDIGDAIEISSAQLINNSDADLAEMTNAKVAGFALERAEGIAAGSRSLSGFGAIENQFRTFVPWNAPGLLMRTKNYVTDGGVVQAAKTGALIGTTHCIYHASTGIQYVMTDTPTGGTDFGAYIVAVLDNNMLPVNADASLTAGDGWLVWRPVQG